MNEVIHLLTGGRVCSQLVCWCRAAVVVVDGEATNATDKVERATCEVCLEALRWAEAATTTRTPRPDVDDVDAEIDRIEAAALERVRDRSKG